MVRVRVSRRDETAEFGGDGRVFDPRGGGDGGFRRVFARRSIYMFFIFLKKRRRLGFRKRRLGLVETGGKKYFRPG